MIVSSSLTAASKNSLAYVSLYSSIDIGLLSFSSLSFNLSIILSIVLPSYSPLDLIPVLSASDVKETIFVVYNFVTHRA